MDKQRILELNDKINRGVMDRGWHAAHFFENSYAIGWYALGFEDPSGKRFPHVMVKLPTWEINYATQDGMDRGRIALGPLLEFVLDQDEPNHHRIVGANIERIVEAVDRLRWVIDSVPPGTWKSRQRLIREDFEIQLDAARVSYRRGDFAVARAALNGARLLTTSGEREHGFPVAMKEKPDIVCKNVMAHSHVIRNPMMEVVIRYQSPAAEVEMLPEPDEIGFGEYEPQK